MVARGGAGSMRDALSLLDQALAHATGRLDATEVVRRCSAVRPSSCARRSSERSPMATPRRRSSSSARCSTRATSRVGVAEDLLRGARDAFLLTAGAGRVAVEGTEEERTTLTELGATLGTPAVVRVVETLGQAIVDMRGVDAADPRLVLEVALVRLSRREAGPPIVLLEERVSRLEAASAASPPSSSAPPTASTASDCIHCNGRVRRRSARSVPCAASAPRVRPSPNRTGSPRLGKRSSRCRTRHHPRRPRAPP